MKNNSMMILVGIDVLFVRQSPTYQSRTWIWQTAWYYCFNRNRSIYLFIFFLTSKYLFYEICAWLKQTYFSPLVFILSLIMYFFFIFLYNYVPIANNIIYENKSDCTRWDGKQMKKKIKNYLHFFLDRE